MKLKNNITTAGINEKDNYLEKSSKKTKSKLLSLIQSGDMVSVIGKLSKKQKKLSKIYEKEGLSDNFLKKTKKWIEKVNLYLDHGGKAYLLESSGGEFHNLCITGLSLDKKGVTLQSVAPYQYVYENIEERNIDYKNSQKRIEYVFALDIGKQEYSISH